MTFESLNYELKEGGIAVLAVNRPKALNALNSQVLAELAQFFGEAAVRKDIRAVIFTGAGEKAFIAGADIAEMSGLSRTEALKFAEAGQRVTKLIEAFPAPVIAAVNGYALGGGCEMALSCDFIIASEKALFGQPEVSLGLITGFGGAIRLAEFVGWPRARELIYTGRRIGAAEALRIGLVNRVVAPEALTNTAFEVAREIAAQSPFAVRKVKKVMLDVRSEALLSERLYMEAKAFSEVFESHDQKEGTKAFLEKRKAQFTGE